MTDDMQRARELEAVAERNLRSYVIRHVPAGPDRASALLCIDTLTALRTVPDGFVLVPVEPTEDMKRAGTAHVGNPYGLARDVWAAMLAARPQGVE